MFSALEVPMFLCIVSAKLDIILGGTVGWIGLKRISAYL